MTLAWGLFAAYLVATSWLGWLGFRQTRGFGSFAIGNGDMNPYVVGVTLAASTASAATFIINPGFIYVDGFSAWFHLVPGLCIGFFTMLTILSFRFRRIGAQSGALTIPDWIGRRYDSSAFALYFSVLALLSFAFVVLLVGGISIVMQPLLGLTNTQALALTLIFVTGYVLVGGTYAHVLTNVLQGTLMIGVSVLILASVAYVVLGQSEPIIEQLRAIDPGLVAPVKGDGQLFNDVFSIYVAGFVIGAVLVCQPHILTKALYVKDDAAVRSYLWIFCGVFTLFALLVTVGFVAHLVVPETALIDPASGAFRQDLVMTVYLKTVFPDWVFTVIAVVLLAAAMSTLDGLLVGLSTIAANDLALNLLGGGMTSEQRMKLALRISHGVLIVVAIAAFIINLNPPRLLGVFGQVGVYGLAVAASPPLLAGVIFPLPRLVPVWIASAVALAVHFGLYFGGASVFPDSPVSFANPGVTAAIATLVALPPLMIYGALAGWGQSAPAAETSSA